MIQLNFTSPLNKPLKISSIGLASVSSIMFLLLFSILLGTGIAYFGLSGIGEMRKDYHIGQNRQPIEAEIHGECRTRKLFFTSCKVTIVHENGSVKKSFDFLSFGNDGFSVQAITNRNNPQQVTLDLAADKMMARVGFVAFMAITGLGLMGTGLFTILVVMPRNKQILARLNQSSSQPWRLVLVQPKSLTSGTAIYQVKHQGKMVKLSAHFGKKAQPFLATDKDDNVYLVAFAPNKGGVPVVVDADLSVIDHADAGEKAMLADVMNQAIQDAGYVVV